MAMKYYSFDKVLIEESNDFPDDFSGIAVNFYGDKYWYLNGKLHRLNSPAWEGSNGTKLWYKEGNLHRVDGAAVENSDGTREWWIDNKRIFCNTNEEFKLLVDIMKLKGLI